MKTPVVINIFLPNSNCKRICRTCRKVGRILCTFTFMILVSSPFSRRSNLAYLCAERTEALLLQRFKSHCVPRFQCVLVLTRVWGHLGLRQTYPLAAPRGRLILITKIRQGCTFRPRGRLVAKCPIKIRAIDEPSNLPPKIHLDQNVYRNTL